MITCKVQFNYSGQFRIVLEDKDQENTTEPATKEVVGSWASNYSLLATLEYKGQIYIAGSTFEYKGQVYIAGSKYGLLPKAETVYKLVELETTLDRSMEWIDSNGKDHYV